MPRPPGTPRTGGRKVGTPNKRTQNLQEKLHKLDGDPIEGMAEIAKPAITEGSLALAGQMYKELAQYLYPKRKAVEVTNDLDDAPVAEVTFHVVNARNPERKRRL